MVLPPDRYLYLPFIFSIFPILLFRQAILAPLTVNRIRVRRQYVVE